MISAARGRCWLSIRNGGPSGAVVYEGVLEQGKSLRFHLGHTLWVRMGRPNALDVSVGGRLVGGLPAVPANVLLTSNGARKRVSAQPAAASASSTAGTSPQSSSSL